MAGKVRLRGSWVDKDRGYKRITQQLMAGARGAYVKVGIIGGYNDRHEGDGIDSVELGLVHEFGVPDKGIPERSWLRSAVDKYRQDWSALRERLVRKIYDGEMDIEQALGVLGERAAADIRNHITQGEQIPPPNAPATYKRKAEKGDTGGEPRTLVDTSRMVQSITYMVKMGEGSGD